MHGLMPFWGLSTCLLMAHNLLMIPSRNPKLKMRICYSNIRNSEANIVERIKIQLNDTGYIVLVIPAVLLI